MKKLLDVLTMELQTAFKTAGYDEKYGKVTISNRPDLCEFQCNGAMSAAKEYKKAPIAIANDVSEALAGNEIWNGLSQEWLKDFQTEWQSFVRSSKVRTTCDSYFGTGLEKLYPLQTAMGVNKND